MYYLLLYSWQCLLPRSNVTFKVSMKIHLLHQTITITIYRNSMAQGEFKKKKNSSANKGGRVTKHSKNPKKGGMSAATVKYSVIFVC